MNRSDYVPRQIIITCPECDGWGMNPRWTPPGPYSEGPPAICSVCKGHRAVKLAVDEDDLETLSGVKSVR